MTIDDSVDETRAPRPRGADRPRRLIIALAGAVFAVAGLGFGYLAVHLWFTAPALTAAAGNHVAHWLALSACALTLTIGVAALWTRDRVAGVLLTAAGACFAVSLWGPAAAYAPGTIVIAAILGAACVPLVAAVAVVSSPNAPGTRTLLVALFVALTATGLLPALFADPASNGCWVCAASPLAITDDPALSIGLSRGTALIAAGIAGAVAAFLTVRTVLLIRAGRVSAALVLLPAAACLLVSVGHFSRVAAGSARSTEDVDVLLLVAMAFAMIALALGMLAGRLRALTTRTRAAELVADLSTTPAAGAQDLLRRALDEPGLSLGFPVSERTLVARDGSPFQPEPDARTTELAKAGTPVALVVVPAGGRHEPERLHQAAVGAWIAIENDRSIAVLAYRERELRDARLRLAAASDRERRRLYRDLHDGAQQRLVALSIDAELLRSRTGDHPAATAIGDAAESLRVAVAELRRVSGLSWSTLLVERGLADAVHALDESVPWPVRLDHASTTRLDPLAETAAYAVVWAAAAMGEVTVRIHAEGPTHVLELDCAACPDDLEGLTDRVAGAGGGMHAIRLPNGAAQLRLEFAAEPTAVLTGGPT